MKCWHIQFQKAKIKNNVMSDRMHLAIGTWHLTLQLARCVHSFWPFISYTLYMGFFFFFGSYMFLRFYLKLLNRQSWFKHQNYLETLSSFLLFNCVVIVFYLHMKKRSLPVITKDFIHYAPSWCTCYQVSLRRRTNMCCLPISDLTTIL